MPAMTDPAAALTSFQQAVTRQQIDVQRGALDPTLVVHLDQPNGLQRFTYAHLDRQIITALAMFVVVEPIDGIPCFHMGVAVPAAYRKQGRAKKVIEAGIAEMKHGFARTPLTKFYIEAVVGTDNIASQRVAAQTISAEPAAITDEISGPPALQYLQLISIE
jgi:hypothetical protein